MCVHCQTFVSIILTSARVKVFTVSTSRGRSSLFRRYSNIVVLIRSAKIIPSLPQRSVQGPEWLVVKADSRCVGPIEARRLRRGRSVFFLPSASLPSFPPRPSSAVTADGRTDGMVQRAIASSGSTYRCRQLISMHICTSSVIGRTEEEASHELPGQFRSGMWSCTERCLGPLLQTGHGGECEGCGEVIAFVSSGR